MRNRGETRMSIKDEVRHFISATLYTMAGIKVALKETAFRQEIFFGVIHYVGIYFVSATFSIKLVLAVLWPLILSAELINSAVEQVVNHISPEWNEFAKYAKDMCSAAVGILIFTTICTWCAVLISILL